MKLGQSNFHKDAMKIVDFLLIANFWKCAVFLSLRRQSPQASSKHFCSVVVVVVVVRHLSQKHWKININFRAVKSDLIEVNRNLIDVNRYSIEVNRASIEVSRNSIEVNRNSIEIYGDLIKDNRVDRS